MLDGSEGTLHFGLAVLAEEGVLEYGVVVDILEYFGFDGQGELREDLDVLDLEGAVGASYERVEQPHQVVPDDRMVGLLGGHFQAVVDGCQQRSEEVVCVVLLVALKLYYSIYYWS